MVSQQVVALPNVMQVRGLSTTGTGSDLAETGAAFNEFPNEFNWMGSRFVLLGCALGKVGHFMSIVKLPSCWLFYDGMGGEEMFQPISFEITPTDARTFLQEKQCSVVVCYYERRVMTADSMEESRSATSNSSSAAKHHDNDNIINPEARMSKRKKWGSSLPSTPSSSSTTITTQNKQKKEEILAPSISSSLSDGSQESTPDMEERSVSTESSQSNVEKVVKKKRKKLSAFSSSDNSDKSSCASWEKLATTPVATKKSLVQRLKQLSSPKKKLQWKRKSNRLNVLTEGMVYNSKGSLPSRKKCWMCSKFIILSKHSSISITQPDSTGKLIERIIHCSVQCVTKLDQKTLSDLLKQQWVCRDVQNVVQWIQDNEKKSDTSSSED